MKKLFICIIGLLIISCADYPKGSKVSIELSGGEKYSCEDACVKVSEGLSWVNDTLIIYCDTHPVITKARIDKKSIKSIKLEIGAAEADQICTY